MATKTTTAASAATLPRLVHAGVNVVRGTFMAAGTTVSAGDVVQMVKVPRNAHIVEMLLGGDGGNTALVVTVGDGSLSNRFMTTTTLSVTGLIARLNNPAGLGFQVSLSDDATSEFDTIDMTVQSTASATTTASIILEVFYVAPGQI